MLSNELLSNEPSLFITHQNSLVPEVHQSPSGPEGGNLVTAETSVHHRNGRGLSTTAPSSGPDGEILFSWLARQFVTKRMNKVEDSDRLISSVLLLQEEASTHLSASKTCWRDKPSQQFLSDFAIKNHHLKMSGYKKLGVSSVFIDVFCARPGLCSGLSCPPQSSDCNMHTPLLDIFCCFEHKTFPQHVPSVHVDRAK